MHSSRGGILALQSAADALQELLCGLPGLD